MRLSAARSAFLAPKARAISRTPTLPLRSRMKATTSSREGRRLIGRAAADRLAFGVLRRFYSAACVVLRGGLSLVGRFAVAPGDLFDDALMCRAVPGDGRFALRGRACGAGALRSARASIRATASSRVTVSGVLSAGSVALMPPWLTYGP